MDDNALYYGDCLDWMREWPDESVDLIYLDPPFNSNADYDIIFVASVFAVMERADRHTFQVLTKRPGRAAALAPSLPWPPNVWLGVSVENQRWTARIDALREIPAAVRFLSCEPLLGPLELDLGGVGWVIAGGESGPRARPMRPEWARGVRDQCLAAGVPFFFKQWGEHGADGRRAGKKRAGRLLDGRTWDEAPARGGRAGRA